MADPAPAPDRLPQAKRLILWDGVFSRMMDTITGGVFLAGLGIHAGFSSSLIGLLAAIPFLAQVAQFPAVRLMQRVHDRRRIVVVASLISRAMLFLIAALLLSPLGLGRTTLLAIVFVMAFFAVLSAAAWNWWMRDIIPREELGTYFGRRLRWTSLAAAVLLFGAGLFLQARDDAGQASQGYAVLFGAGGLFGMVSVGFLMATPHPAVAVPPQRVPAWTGILQPLREPHVRRLAFALMAVAASLAIALPFTAVHMLRGLQLTYLQVALLALLNLLAYTSSLRGWGYASDRWGNRPVLQMSMGLLIVALLGWGLTWARPEAALFAFLAGLHFLSGFAVGGIELTAANVLLKTAPQQEAPAYMAALSLVRALAAGVATIGAGALWELLGSGGIAYLPLPGDATWTVRGFHVLAFLSAGVGIVALASLPRVEEAGSHEVAQVARLMRREVHMMSSVAGIRAFVHVVSYAVEFFSRPPRVLKRPPGKRTQD